MERIAEEIPEDYPSSPSDSDNEITGAIDSNFYRLFGRQKSVHQIFGGGKPADILLWRDRKLSVGAIGVATAIWISFEVLEYNLLTFVSHLMILALTVLFLWSNVSKFISESPPTIPQVHIPEEPLLEFAYVVSSEINLALDIYTETCNGRNLRMFLIIVFGLWATSIVGSWFSFLTLLYILFLLLHTVPVVYDKYDEKIDLFVEKAIIEIRKRYEAFLSKIPKSIFKDKKDA